MMGLATALGGSETQVEAFPGQRRTELRKYGISNGRPLRCILRTTPSQAGGNSAAEGVGMQLVLQFEELILGLLV